MQNKILLSGLFIALILFSGCTETKLKITSPEGFAVYKNVGTLPYRAVSPDGILYRVKEVENKPFANLKFWQEALKKHMITTGYSFVND